jgi:hypothetical protein
LDIRPLGDYAKYNIFNIRPLGDYAQYDSFDISYAKYIIFDIGPLGDYEKYDIFDIGPLVPWNGTWWVQVSWRIFRVTTVEPIETMEHAVDLHIALVDARS